MADERAVRAAEKLTHRANGCEDIGGVLGGVRERRAATIAVEYSDVLAENERLKRHVVHLTADAAETDQHIREVAKRVLPASQVDGDSVCVPPLEEIVDALVQQVAALRSDAERLQAASEDLCNEVDMCGAMANTPSSWNRFCNSLSLKSQEVRSVLLQSSAK